MPIWTGKWAGGRTYQTKAGTVWVLEKMVNGVAYTIALGAGNEDEAQAELALFRRDAQAYSAQAKAQAVITDDASEPVLLTLEMVDKFLGYLKAEGRTERYRKNVRGYLAAWATVLFGRDLRFLSLQQYKKALSGWYDDEKKVVVAKKHRIAALKTFFTWLREEEAAITVAQDATLALKVPAARPEKSLREKGYEMQHVERLYRAINGWESKKFGWKGTARLTEVQSVRDVLCIHAKCGLHATEIDRLARGEGEVRVLPGTGEIAGTIKFVHKSGRVHLQSLDAQTLTAAQRLQARGSAPVDWWIRQVIKRAADSIGVDPIRLGELRHSFVTWASERGEEIRPMDGGVPLSRIAATIGHHSAVTTKRFYDGTKVPPMIKLPIKLEHPDDPLPLLHRQPKDRSG